MAMSTPLSRRSFLTTAALAAGVTVMGAGCSRDAQSREQRIDATEGALSIAPTSWVPGEDVPLKRIWMGWPSSTLVWGTRLLPLIQHDVAKVARTIARYTPVTMCATNEVAAAQARSRCGSSVRVIDTIGVNDCWLRDSGPVFRWTDAGGRNAIGLRFNGWGHKQTATKDRFVAARVAKAATVPFAQAGFVGEGGAIECDGDGTVMATESSLVNDNRNPGMSKAQVEAAVLAAYGAQKMLWVPGLRGHDITDDHIDATSRFIRPGVVMVQVPPASRTDIWAEDAREQLAILSSATDAKGRSLEIIEMQGPDTVRSDDPNFLDSYVNFVVAGEAIITVQFGDAAKDAAAKDTLEQAFPGRVVVQLNLDNLHGPGGGGVHCITQQEPLPA